MGRQVGMGDRAAGGVIVIMSIIVLVLYSLIVSRLCQGRGLRWPGGLRRCNSVTVY